MHICATIDLRYLIIISDIPNRDKEKKYTRNETRLTYSCFLFKTINQQQLTYQPTISQLYKYLYSLTSFIAHATYNHLKTHKNYKEYFTFKNYYFFFFFFNIFLFNFCVCFI